MNLDSAIQQCLDKFVDDPADIIVDIAVCAHIRDPGTAPKRGGWGNYKLGKDIKDYYLSTN